MIIAAPEVASVERLAVRRSFDRASGRYDQVSQLQARVRAELLDRLTLFGLTAQRIVDLGSGTGAGAQALRRRYRHAQVIALDSSSGMLREARRRTRWFRHFERLCADATALPLRSGCADLLFSSLMLQWCDDVHAALLEAHRVLREGGFFAFSTFGPDTLKELRAAWAEADELSHVNQFLDMHDLGDALMRAGFAEPVLDIERIELSYRDVFSLMRELKAIGAHNVTLGRARHLTGKARMDRMQKAYERLRRDERLPASFEVVYGSAWAGQARPGTSEVHIPLSSIGRSR